MSLRLTNDKLPEYDICIVGGGLAGLTIAAELACDNIKICVLESGLVTKSSFADNLKNVENRGITITSVSRERLVGGSSATWGGLSAPLDEVDFNSRPWTDGWPLSYETLRPYLISAERYHYPHIREFEGVEDDEELFGGSQLGHSQPQNLRAKKFIANVPPFRYTSLRYIFDRKNVDLITDATVIKLERVQSENEEETVRAAVCLSSSRDSFRVKAQLFIIATGGIENARLLLLSDIGNKHDQVGRYFMNHPFGRDGFLHLRKSLPRTSTLIGRSVSSTRFSHSGLRLSPEYQEAHNLHNSYVGFELFFGTSNRDRIVQKWYLLHQKLERRLPKFLLSILSLFRPPLLTLRLRWFLEMEPRPENRVTLSTIPDAFGIPMPLVEHNLSERDKNTARALFNELKIYLEQNHIGTVNGDIEEIISKYINIDASHHMGGTRIGTDPKTSVVDLNCRVHGTDNLYIAGSSIFPTGGNANPTFTITALTLRLAEHIRNIFSHKLQSITSPPASDKNIIIIGGGKRVREDVVPVLEFLEPLFNVSGVYTQQPGVVFGRKRRYETIPISALRAEIFKSVKYIYLAVPPRAVKTALMSLPPEAFDTELIIDTPAPTHPETLQLLKQFKKIHVAEDSAYLPWLESARSHMINNSEIVCDSSLFHYHGVALLKALCGKEKEVQKKEDFVKLIFKTSHALLKGSCDYAHGSLTIDGRNIAFPSLTAEENDLVGLIRETDTIVTKMLELKRIGLARMLSLIANGKDPYSLEEAIDDLRLDSIVHKLQH